MYTAKLSDVDSGAARADRPHGSLERFVVYHSTHLRHEFVSGRFRACLFLLPVDVCSSASPNKHAWRDGSADRPWPPSRPTASRLLRTRHRIHVPSEGLGIWSRPYPTTRPGVASRRSSLSSNAAEVPGLQLPHGTEGYLEARDGTGRVARRELISLFSAEPAATRTSGCCLSQTRLKREDPNTPLSRLSPASYPRTISVPVGTVSPSRGSAPFPSQQQAETTRAITASEAARWPAQGSKLRLLYHRAVADTARNKTHLGTTSTSNLVYP
uniref:Uncharacterized protein n=1 Tax=Mycena chlorophos TaxID=658473 RepID=A0ABQ0M0S5_MYCCL|nr:predicted protein [Mycena chlorophos]